MAKGRDRMIKKLICLLFGCKTVTETYYEKQSHGHYEHGFLYNQLPFCRRCGKDVKG